MIAHFDPDWTAQFDPEYGAHFAPVLYAHFTPESIAQFDRIFHYVKGNKIYFFEDELIKWVEKDAVQPYQETYGRSYYKSRL